MTPAGIEPATFRFVAQHLNHCVTAVTVCAENLANPVNRVGRIQSRSMVKQVVDLSW